MSALHRRLHRRLQLHGISSDLFSSTESLPRHDRQQGVVFSEGILEDGVGSSLSSQVHMDASSWQQKEHVQVKKRRQHNWRPLAQIGVLGTDCSAWSSIGLPRRPAVQRGTVGTDVATWRTAQFHEPRPSGS